MYGYVVLDEEGTDPERDDALQKVYFASFKSHVQFESPRARNAPKTGVLVQETTSFKLCPVGAVQKAAGDGPCECALDI